MQPRTSCEASCGRTPPNNSSAKNILIKKMEEKKKIEQDLSFERRSYEKYHLDESTVTDNPMDLFQAWYNLADASNQIEEANAMTVSTPAIAAASFCRSFAASRSSKSPSARRSTWEASTPAPCWARVIG